MQQSVGKILAYTKKLYAVTAGHILNGNISWFSEFINFIGCLTHNCQTVECVAVICAKTFGIILVTIHKYGRNSAFNDLGEYYHNIFGSVRNCLKYKTAGRIIVYHLFLMIEKKPYLYDIKCLGELYQLLLSKNMADLTVPALRALQKSLHDDECNHQMKILELCMGQGMLKKLQELAMISRSQAIVRHALLVAVEIQRYSLPFINK